MDRRASFASSTASSESLGQQGIHRRLRDVHRLFAEFAEKAGRLASYLVEFQREVRDLGRVVGDAFEFWRALDW